MHFINVAFFESERPRSHKYTVEAAVGKKRKRSGPPACGYALNWYAGCQDVEVLISSRGVKQGATRNARPRSRLCKAEMAALYAALRPTNGASYRVLKLASKTYQAEKAEFMSSPPWNAWIKLPDDFEAFTP